MLITVLLRLAFALGVHAADLKPPFALPSARTLPKGVRNLSYKSVLARAEDKYNNSGQQVSVADPFFKGITFRDMIQGKRDPGEKAGIIQVMDALGAAQDDQFANTLGQVNIKATAHVPVLAWGINSKLTIAAAIPILQYSTNVSTGVVQTNSALYAEMLEKLQSKGATQKSQELIQKLSRPIDAKLEEYGYEPLANESATVLGDMKVVGKQALWSNDLNLLTLQMEVTLPTGKSANVNKAINVTGGDGQTDLGMGVIHDLNLGPFVTISSMVFYNAQFEDREDMRIPERVDSKVSPDKERVRRNLGDSALFHVGPKLNWYGINLGAGYAFQYKEKDEYQGNIFPSYRYSWMEQETRQRMETMQFSAGLDTLTLFRQGKFKVPLSALVNYTVVTRGKNVVTDPVLSLDFNLFF